MWVLPTGAAPPASCANATLPPAASASAAAINATRPVFPALNENMNFPFARYVGAGTQWPGWCFESQHRAFVRRRSLSFATADYRDDGTLQSVTKDVAAAAAAALQCEHEQGKHAIAHPRRR